jgi:hypothetical protein
MPAEFQTDELCRLVVKNHPMMISFVANPTPELRQLAINAKIYTE